MAGAVGARPELRVGLEDSGLTGGGAASECGYGGAGVFKYADGDVYDGEWKDGDRNGRGEGRGGSFLCK